MYVVGDVVHVNGDESVCWVITRILFDPTQTYYDLDAKVMWLSAVPENTLTLAKDQVFKADSPDDAYDRAMKGL